MKRLSHTPSNSLYRRNSTTEEKIPGEITNLNSLQVFSSLLSGRKSSEVPVWGGGRGGGYEE